MSQNADWWWWCCDFKRACFEEMSKGNFIFISDRDKGLGSAIFDFFPDSYQALCCEHIEQNVQKKFGLKARQVSWKIARPNEASGSRAVMEELRTISPEAVVY